MKASGCITVVLSYNKIFPKNKICIENSKEINLKENFWLYDDVG